MGGPLHARRSIRGKIDRLVAISVGVALLVAGTLGVWHETSRYLETKREALQTTAQVFGAAASRAVAADDAAAVTRSIRAIARVPGFVYAEVLDRRGAPLAEIGTAVSLVDDLQLGDGPLPSPLELLTTRTVTITVPVLEGGEAVGRIRLVSETGDLLAPLRDTVFAALIGSIAALGLGLALSRRLQRAITRPLVELAGAMTEVRRTNTYVPMVGPVADDEIGLLSTSFNGMIAEIRRATDEILTREKEIIGRLSRAAEQRDDQTGRHVVRVAAVSRLIALRLGQAAAFVDDLHRASPMHDIGKISVPDAILFKPGRLDPDERHLMESHARAGHAILSGSSSHLVQLAAEIALTHHERWDGQGYPAGLAGEAIPLAGRITAVADVCDALLSSRPYKQAWSLEQVRAHLAENAGSHFDPSCVEALLSGWDQVEAVYAADRSEPVGREAA